MDKDKIQRMTTHKGIKWKFNPPGGSHFGGVHDIMFEAAKKAIYAVLRSSDITDEERPHQPFFVWTNGRTVCTGECWYYEIQSKEEMVKGARVNLSSVV